MPEQNPLLFGGDRRRHGRIRVDAVTCDDGEVLDLSPSGARIRRKGRQPVTPGDVLTVRIRHANGEVSVQGEVQWVCPPSERAQELGLRFGPLPIGVEPLLVEVALTHFAHEVAGVAQPRPLDFSWVRRALGRVRRVFRRKAG